MSRRSISSVSPAATRYCLPPVSKTAYINGTLTGRPLSHSEFDLSIAFFQKPVRGVSRLFRTERECFPLGRWRRAAANFVAAAKHGPLLGFADRSPVAEQSANDSPAWSFRRCVPANRALAPAGNHR